MIFFLPRKKVLTSHTNVLQHDTCKLQESYPLQISYELLLSPLCSSHIRLGSSYIRLGEWYCPLPYIFKSPFRSVYAPSLSDQYLFIPTIQRQIYKTYTVDSLSRIPRDFLKHFEISVPRHIRVAELRKNNSNNHI